MSTIRGFTEVHVQNNVTSSILIIQILDYPTIGKYESDNMGVVNELFNFL